MDESFPIKRQNTRTLSLVVFTLMYLLTGAAIFDMLESSVEHANREFARNKFDAFRNKTNMTQLEVETFVRHLMKRGVRGRAKNWDFSGSLYFCTLVLALIGYGHSTPHTIYGKLFCIIYAFGGIPISLIMFQSVGERLNSFLRYAINKLKSSTKLFPNLQNKEATNTELIFVELWLTVFLLLGASYVFSTFEEWSYFDSFYYSFITLTTIGNSDQIIYKFSF